MNAIDYLYNEWIGKPSLIVIYGMQGQNVLARSWGRSGLVWMWVVETKPRLALRKDEQMMHIGKGGVCNPNVYTKHYQIVIPG
jgi:hypothetical protein